MFLKLYKSVSHHLQGMRTDESLSNAVSFRYYNNSESRKSTMPTGANGETEAQRSAAFCPMSPSL